MAGGPLAAPAMSREIVYADLDVGPGKHGRKQHWLPQPGALGCPRWYRTALWASWTGNLLLGVAVVAMGCLFLHQKPQNPGSCRNGSGTIGDGTSTVENISSELRKTLCVSELQEGEGCKLCPMGWMPHYSKCYWVANRTNPWNKSREDCDNRSAKLLMLGDQDELAFVKGILQKPSGYFWIGLFLPPAGQDWTWVNGSHLDRSWFQLGSIPRDEGKICGAIRGDRIDSESCSSGLHWICQKEATQL